MLCKAAIVVISVILFVIDPSLASAQLADQTALKRAAAYDGTSGGVFLRDVKLTSTAQGDLRPTAEGQRWLLVEVLLIKLSTLPSVVATSSIEGIQAVAPDGTAYPIAGFLPPTDSAIKYNAKKGTFTVSRLPASIGLLFIVPAGGASFEIRGTSSVPLFAKVDALTSQEEFEEGFTTAARALAASGRVVSLPAQGRLELELAESDPVVTMPGNHSRLLLMRLPEFVEPYRRLEIQLPAVGDQLPLILGVLLDDKFQTSGLGIIGSSYTAACKKACASCLVT